MSADPHPMLRIEAARPDDFLAVAALDRTAWSQNRGCEFVPDGEHTWKIWCAHALVFVAKDEGNTMAGAILAFPCVDGVFCLHKIMLAEAFRGRGEGLRLMHAMLDALDECSRSCFLTVDPSNHAAIRLYQKLGFAIVETVKGYYRDTEDRHVMVRPPKNHP